MGFLLQMTVLLLPQVFHLDQVDRQARAGRQVPVQLRGHLGHQQQAVLVGLRAAAAARVQAVHLQQVGHQVLAQQQGQVVHRRLAVHQVHRRQTALAVLLGHLDLAAARAAQAHRGRLAHRGQVQQMVQGGRQVLRGLVRPVEHQDQARLVGRLVLRVQARQQGLLVHQAFKVIDMPQLQQQHLHWVMQEQ